MINSDEDEMGPTKQNLSSSCCFPLVLGLRGGVEKINLQRGRVCKDILFNRGGPSGLLLNTTELYTCITFVSLCSNLSRNSK